jgi:hypothetical protein
VWLRDPSNAAWNAVATIGPPFKWTAIDVPAAGFTTGDVKLTLKSSAESGWVLMNDGSIGNASSSATARANADTSDLFALLWTNVSNTWCPVQDASGTPVSRGASAASDFAANRRLVLPKRRWRRSLPTRWCRRGGTPRPKYPATIRRRGRCAPPSASTPTSSSPPASDARGRGAVTWGPAMVLTFALVPRIVVLISPGW